MEQHAFNLTVLSILVPIAVMVGRAALNVNRAAKNVVSVLKQYPPHAHTPDGFILYPEGYDAPTFKTFGESRPKKAHGAGSSE